MIDVGARSGALTRVLETTGAEVVAVELDPVWAKALRERQEPFDNRRARVLQGDFLSMRFPTRPFRIVGCLPFGSTTAILSKLFDDPSTHLFRADLILQWEVARKRASSPPSTLLSTCWTPWWEFRLGRRIPATEFRPIPSVDGGVLTVTRRSPALLPNSMSGPYREFVRSRWPFYDERNSSDASHTK